MPAAVLEAFGLPQRGELLPGGEGRCFHHGPTVLKPADDPSEAAWSAELLASIEQRGFRLARPLRAADGRWVVDGWTATEHVQGRTGPAGHWQQLLRTSRAFHLALRDAPRPAFLDGRTHRYARADRAAWGEQGVPIPPDARDHWSRLAALRRPVGGRAQLIHGDIAGNVLFTDDELPTIIDFSPYWRPAGYGEAVALVDGLLWYDGDRQLTAAWAAGNDSAQLLVRALIFRLVAATEAAREGATADLAGLAAFDPVIDFVDDVVASTHPSW